MNKRTLVTIAIVIIAAVLVVAISYVVLTKKGRDPPVSVEHVGGKYNVTLSLYEDNSTEIGYTDETGSHSERYFEPLMRVGLNWIGNNTPENATFLCWWDYGHMIKGYAERSAVVRNPSHEWIGMIAEPWRSRVTEFDPNQKIVDVAKAFTTSNSNETKLIMERYNASYIVVYKDDIAYKAAWMCKVAGLEPLDYLTPGNNTMTPTEAGMQMMISRLVDNRDTGFALIYQDTVMSVYRKD